MTIKKGLVWAQLLAWALIVTAGVSGAAALEIAVQQGKIVVYKAQQGPVAYEQVAKIVKERVGEAGDVYRIKVFVEHEALGKPGYRILAYILSSKDYSYTTTKIQADEGFGVQGVMPGYRVTEEEAAATRGEEKYSCPDGSVNFVTATPVPDISTAINAVQEVQRKAQAAGYKTFTMSGDDASTKNYLSWLSCPNLKGFYNVGHGSPTGIILSDGELSSDQLGKARFGKTTVVVFNSCEVFNEPLKGVMLKAQRYAGGVTTLSIGPSEKASTCFWDAAIKGRALTSSLYDCAQKNDPDDTWGIDGSGQDTMGGRMMLSRLDLDSVGDVKSILARLQ